MKATFTLGRIAGVRIGVHWSVLVIFGLIALGLAAGRLPEVYPGHGWGVYALAGVVTAVVFFASLLAHELAHAVVARRNGVPVDDIVLWLLGGATRMRAEAPDPGAELRISGVGPLVSLGLGAAFSLVTVAVLATAGDGLAAESVAWLAGINVLLAVFNAIPAAPLDGGRLLRAFLWWRGGDRLRATVRATAAGRVVGWVLVGLGLWGFVFTAAFGSLWLSLIGWFLVVAATEEERQARLRETLSGVPVRASMTPDPETVPPEITVDRFLSDPGYAGRMHHSAYPVTGRGGQALGLVTRREAERVAAEVHHSTTVGEVMVPLGEARTAGPGDPLAELLPQVEPGPERRVLVVEGERLVGILSPSDVSRTVSRLSRWRGQDGGGGAVPGTGPGGAGWGGRER